MEGVDLNDAINWDELDDFDGEARELGGDFFFDTESDEDEGSDGEHPRQMMRMDSSMAGNCRGRGTLGLTGLRTAQRWNAGGSSSGGDGRGAGRGHGFIEDTGGHGAGRGEQSTGQGSDGGGRGAGRGHGFIEGTSSDVGGHGAGRGQVDDEPELVRYPLFDGVFMFASPSIRGRGRLGLSGRGRGTCPPFRGATAAGRGAVGRCARGRGEAAGRGLRGRGAGAGRGAAARRGRGRGAAAGRGNGDGGGDDQEQDPDGHQQVVPLGQLVNVRRVYSDADKMKIYAAILRKTGPDVGGHEAYGGAPVQDPTHEEGGSREIGDTTSSASCRSRNCECS